MKKLKIFSAMFVLLLVFTSQPTIHVPQPGRVWATVPTDANRMDYVATAAQTIFPYTFKIFASTDLKVYVNGAPKALTTDYTVSGVLNPSGGNVTFLAGLTAGDAVAIIRQVPITQNTDYVPNSPFPAQSHEDALDRQTMVSQQLKEELSRAPKFAATYPVSPTLAIPAAGEYLRWDLTGMGIESTAQISTTGTFTASGTGAVARTVDSKLGDVVSVKDFGAKGDGVTSDSAAILAAINSLSSGKEVFFPLGTYRISATISLAGKSKITLRGSGRGTILDNSGNNTRVFDLANSSGIVIENLAFHGDFDTADHSAQGAVITDNTAGNVTSNIAIRNCYFEDLAGDAIRIGPGTGLVEISSNVMVGGLGFVELAGTAAVGVVHDVRIFGNSVRGSLVGGRAGGLGSDDIIDTYGGVYKLAIFGNTFDLQGTSATDTIGNSAIVLNPQGAAYGELRDISITGNAFYRCDNDGSVTSASGGILIVGDTDATAFQSVSIAGNTFHTARHAVIASSTGSPVSQISVAGNTINTVSYRGISVRGHNAQIIGNTIKDISGSGVAIYLEGNGYHCTGNYIENLDGTVTGIWSTTGNDGRITGNIIDTGEVGTRGIYVIGTRTVVTENTISNIAGTAIQTHASASNAIIERNKFYNNGANLTDAGTATNIFALADDATPSILGSDKWVTGGTTTITDFDDGYVGQVIIVIAAHTVEITDGTNIFLSGSANFTMNATDTLTLIQKSDGKWYEKGRSDNT